MESNPLNTTQFEKVFGEHPASQIIQVKLALIGYPATGKSSFVKRFTQNVFPNEHIPNDKIQITSEVLKTPDNKIFEIFLYEVPGQTQYVDLKTLFMSRIQGIIYMFGHHYPYSFSKLDYLMGFADKYFLGQCDKIIVGNTFADRQNSVYPYQAYEFCGQRGLNYVRINIKDDPASVNDVIGYFLSKHIQPHAIG